MTSLYISSNDKPSKAFLADSSTWSVDTNDITLSSTPKSSRTVSANAISDPISTNNRYPAFVGLSFIVIFKWFSTFDGGTSIGALIGRT